MKSAVSVLKDDGNDTKAIENFINGNRLSIAINVFGNQWAIFCLLLSDIYISELYKYVFCFILIHKLKSDLEGSGSNPMSHAYCVARQFSGKHTPTFWEGPGFKFRTGHGGWGCVDDTCEEKAYDQMGTRTRDLSQTVQILWPLS